MKTKKYLRKAREYYIENDLDGAMISLSYAYALGSDIAAISLNNVIDMNLDVSDKNTPKIGTLRLLLPEKQTKFSINSFLLYQTANAYYFTVLADSLYQKMIFPMNMNELYKTGNVARKILELERIQKDPELNTNKKYTARLKKAVENNTIQVIESNSNAYNLYSKSYKSRKDLYSLYSMAYMQEYGLGVEKNLVQANQKYKEVFKGGFGKLFAPKSK